MYPTVSANTTRAVEEARKTIELDPDFPIGYLPACLQLCSSSADLAEAENSPSAGLRAQTGNPEFFVQRYDIAFLKGDQAGMEREAALAQGKPGAEDWISDARGFCPGLFRSPADRREAMSRRAVDLAQQAGQPEGRLCSKPAAALWEAFFGNVPGGQAERDARRWSFQRIAMWSMALRLRWPSPGILPGRKRSRTIWKSASRRIRQSDSLTCRRFARFSR